MFSLASDKLTFVERLKSVIGHIIVEFLLRRAYSSYTDRMIANKFGTGGIPPALEIEKNASLVLLSSSPAIDYSKALLPNVVEVGGMHCTEPQPLPKDLADFIGDSEFIFFSLGTVARSQQLSQKQESVILETLGTLPFPVLLKWDRDNITGIPVNIFPSKWLPQQDILGSSNCRLFVSHGGYASLVESVCHGVPMVMMPISADQYFNARNAAGMGMAETLSWDDLTPQTLRSAITSGPCPPITVLPPGTVSG